MISDEQLDEWHNEAWSTLTSGNEFISRPHTILLNRHLNLIQEIRKEREDKASNDADYLEMSIKCNSLQNDKKILIEALESSKLDAEIIVKDCEFMRDSPKNNPGYSYDGSLLLDMFKTSLNRISSALEKVYTKP